jgi:hypothetical protein
MRFTDYHAQTSCTAGRVNFITGELPAAPANYPAGMASSTASSAA